MSLPYWFSIVYGDASCGGAFLISRKYALTATHCLPKGFLAESESAEPSRVRLISESGLALVATVSETDGDLALLEIAAFRNHDIVAPQIHWEPVEKESSWEAPYRPSVQHPTLTGVVGNPDLNFQCADGTLISAIQLTVSEEIGDHSGYSGGPVVRKSSPQDPVAILGVLLEQFPDRVNQGRAANVLFAARIANAFLNFAAFNFASRLNVIRVSPPHEEIGKVSQDVRARLNEADEILERAKLWAEKSYIDDYDYKVLKARVRNLVFSERPTESTR